MDEACTDTCDLVFIKDDEFWCNDHARRTYGFGAEW